MNRTLTALAGSAVLGLALASSCGSTPPSSQSQTVAWSAPASPGHAAMLARGHHRLASGSAKTALALAAAAVPLAAQKRCARSFTQVHTRNLLDVTMVRTCRHWYEAVGDFGGHLAYGPKRISPGTHSVACDVSSCQSHPDGRLMAGWVKRVTDGATFCLPGISCGRAAAVTLAKRGPYIDIHNSSCLREQVHAWQTLNGNKTGAEWHENGCLWWIRLHVHCAIPSRGLDYGWHYSGWIVSFPPIDTEVTCPSNSFGITVYLQWKHHTGTTIYHRKLVG